MRGKKNREINVFSLSAVDLFASALGVFIIVTVVLIPYMTKKEAKRHKVIEEKLKQEITELRAVTESQKESFSTETQQIQAAQEKVTELQSQLQISQEKVTELEQRLRGGKSQEANSKTDKSAADLKTRTHQVQVLNEKVKELQKLLDQNEQQLKALKVQQTESQMRHDKSGAFMVAIVKWSSPKHDVDLLVEDPKGRLFNFRSREHKGAPGALILDTRTGPGVEVWQTSKLDPGVYKLRYLFYGSYGNSSPVSVEGTIITPPGATALPKVVLKKDKEESPWMKIQVSGDGQVQIL